MIGREEAASALDAVARSRRHAAALRGYAGAGSTLIAYGLAWVAGNATAQFAPAYAGVVWLIGIAAATLWSVTRPGSVRDWRIATTFAAVAAYTLLLLTIVDADARTGNVVVSLLVSVSYVVLGTWTGPRFIGLGLLLAAAVVVGWFLVPASLFACLALGGGGTLIAGGLWLRRA